MKRKITKSLALTAFLFSAMFVSLAFVPHHTCGCGQYEDGSQLTHFINKVSERIIGEPLIEKNSNPFNR